ncbi:uncharacterized protein LY89DRAFT_687358 [Mollisia scopiformis]|uniref:Uncharacterized protein n=1 Tax=Mollisia scopiformis TaxID=149040 RepID=A0A194X278_MOLSC|nr:uncharacterized protein LY89DRAFT_687358 [Mollisia scopiformis]KUJ14109.1 hypothetical protein LY89DRAFT_687358 [Mollisia scopiformis]
MASPDKTSTAQGDLCTNTRDSSLGASSLNLNNLNHNRTVNSDRETEPPAYQERPPHYEMSHSDPNPNNPAGDKASTPRSVAVTAGAGDNVSTPHLVAATAVAGDNASTPHLVAATVAAGGNASTPHGNALSGHEAAATSAGTAPRSAGPYGHTYQPPVRGPPPSRLRHCWICSREPTAALILIGGVLTFVYKMYYLYVVGHGDGAEQAT